MRNLLKFTLWLLSFLAPGCVFALENTDIYCLSFSQRNDADHAVVKTLEELKHRFPTINIHFVNVDELKEAFNKCSNCFFVSTSGDFHLKQLNGAWRIATLMTPYARHPNESEAGAIVVRNNSGIKSLKDLKNKSLVITQRAAFLNTQLALSELVDRGIEPDEYFSEIKELGRPAKGLLSQVSNGRADAALVRAGLLESLKKADSPISQNLEVIETKNGDSLLYKHSTKPVPGWTFFAGSTVDPYVARSLTIDLLTMPANSLDGCQWLLGTNYSQLNQVFKNLKIGPYEYLRSWSARRVWQEYKIWLVSALIIFIFSIVHNWRSSRLIKKKTSQLRHSLEKQKELLNRVQKLNAHVNEMQKLSTVGVLSSITTHELLQPLSASKYILIAIQDAMKNNSAPAALEKLLTKLGGTLDKSIALVERVRLYSRNGKRLRQHLELESSIRKISNDLYEARVISSVPNIFCSESPIYIYFDPFDFEVVLLNILKNANDAQQKIQCQNEPIEIKIHLKNKQARIEISNKGEFISQNDITELSRPFRTTNKKGLGLGMSIISLLMRTESSKVEFQSRKTGGMVIILLFDTIEP